MGLKAQTHFWGYSLKLPTRDSENVSVKVEDAEDKSDDSQDMSPLQASREWVTQAENNVIDRLVEAGLVAPLTPNGFETTVLEQIVTNLAVPNNLALSSPIHCRVLLTDTIETTTVGNTILVSKGLIDTMPRNEATIASVIAMEVAHITLGHHIDTRYAFNDRLLFPDESTFQRIDMYHTDHDNEEASKKGSAVSAGLDVQGSAADGGLVLGTAGRPRTRAEVPQHSQAGRFPAPRRWDSLDDTARAVLPQDQLGRPGPDSRTAAGKLAQDRPVG